MPRALLPQDVVVLATLVSSGGTRPAIAQLAADLLLSPSQVHASLKRLARAHLADIRSGRPILRAVEEFLIHAVNHVFPAQRGETTRGVPTAYAAPQLSAHIVGSGDQPPVWPDPEGKVRGVGFEPLCKSAPKAARKDPLRALCGWETFHQRRAGPSRTGSVPAGIRGKASRPTAMPWATGMLKSAPGGLKPARSSSASSWGEQESTCPDPGSWHACSRRSRCSCQHESSGSTAQSRRTRARAVRPPPYC